MDFHLHTEYSVPNISYPALLHRHMIAVECIFSPATIGKYEAAVIRRGGSLQLRMGLATRYSLVTTSQSCQDHYLLSLAMKLSWVMVTHSHCFQLASRVTKHPSQMHLPTGYSYEYPRLNNNRDSRAASRLRGATCDSCSIASLAGSLHPNLEKYFVV